MDMDKLLKVFDGADFKKMLKDNAIKIFVFVMVIAFVLEMVSLGYLGGLSNGNSSGNSGTTAPANVPQTVFGVITANGTVVSYDPVLYVSGADMAKAQEIKDQLISQGIATYAVNADNSTMLVNLASESDVQKAASEFGGINVSVYAPAQIQFNGNLDLVDDNGTHYSLIPASISYQLLPSIHRGARILVSFNARGDLVQGSATNEYSLTGWGTISVIPTQLTLDTSLPVVAKKSDIVSASILWQDRSLVTRQGVIDAMAGFNVSNVSYSKKSYIEFNPGLTQDQYNALSAAKPSYITALQQAYAGVSDDFTNITLAVGELTPYGPGFPSSTVSFETGADPAQAITALSAYLGSKGVKSKPYASQTYLLGVPATVTGPGNATYSTMLNLQNISIAYDGELAPGDMVPVTITAYEVAGIIVDISSARMAASNQTAPAMNGTVVAGSNQTDYNAPMIPANVSGNATAPDAMQNESGPSAMPPLNSTGVAPGAGIPPSDNSSMNFSG
ncbi:MAG: hypothetical protein WC506_03285 [Candidatus Micrarchaeia archaeon]